MLTNPHSAKMKRTAHPNSLKNLKPIKPGETRNPGGNPRTLRNKLNLKFMGDLIEDYKEHGVQAIAEFRENDPGGYVRMMASLLPKDYNINTNQSVLDELNDEQLTALLDSLRATIPINNGDREHKGETGSKNELH